MGGGQLARMMAPVATALGITLRVLVESEQAAAALPAHQIVVGMPGDPEALAQLLAEPRPAVVTWEHEHIPAEVFDACERAAVPAYPGIGALLYAQDKIEMRRRMDALELPNPAWSPVDSEDEVAQFLSAHEGRGVLKTARGGYDGKGVRVIDDAAQAREWLEASHAGGPAILIEEQVPFDRELAILVARTPSGEVALWPTVESTQREGVCAEVTAPAPDLSAMMERKAGGIADLIASKLDVVGVMAVEMFQVGEELLVNELAMRPHNSGHWTIDGCVTSQFEQHLRAVLDLPLGHTRALAPWTVMANVLGGHRTDLASALSELDDPEAKLHLYGKDVRPGRKVGHVTVTGDDRDEVYRRAVDAAAIVRDGGAP